MANRYTQLSTSTFSPLSMQEILTVPLAKQRMHDEFLAQSGQASMFDLPSLSADDELKNEYIGNFTGKVDSLTDDVMTRGINSNTRSQLQNLISERNQWLTTGDGAKITQNFNLYKQNKENLDKLYASGKIGRDVYQLGLSQAVRNYEGVAAGGQYNSFTPVHDSNYEERARQIAKDISSNPIKITQFSNLQYNPTTGKYVDYKTNREYTPEGAIRHAVMNGLAADDEIMADLSQRQQLGIFGDMSTNDVLDRLGTQAESIFRKDNRSVSRQHVGVDHKALGQANASSSFEYQAVENVKLLENNLAKKLGVIASGGSFGGYGVDDSYVDAMGNTVTNPNSPSYAGEGKPATIENLSASEKAVYSGLVDRMKKSGYIPQDTKIDDPGALQAVQSYISNTNEFTYQPITYTNGVYRTYEGKEQKIKTSTPKDLAKGISLQPENRLWIDIEDGEPLSSFDKMPEKYRTELIEGKARVSGVTGSRNFLPQQYPTVAPDKLASMYEVQFTDGTKMLASRSQGETQTPSYQADVQYGELWRDLRFPDLNVDANINGRTRTLRRNRDMTIDVIGPDGNPYRPNGEPLFRNDDELEKTFKAGMGVNVYNQWKN